MANYEKARIKITNSQLNKLRSAVKNKTVATLTNFQDKKLPHELILKNKTKNQNKKHFS